MEYTQLGWTGVKVSRLCLGTMNFNPGFIPEENSIAILNRAVEIGINFFDTTNGYGDYYSPKNRHNFRAAQPRPAQWQPARPGGQVGRWNAETPR